MITGVELDKFGREVGRVPTEKVPMNTIECTVDLKPLSVSRTHNTSVAHQECDISILKEIYLVPHKRIVSCWAGTLCQVRGLGGSKVNTLRPSASSFGCRHVRILTDRVCRKNGETTCT